MKEKTVFVDCEAIQKALEDALPKQVRVLQVWGGARDGETKLVYVKVNQNDEEDRNPRHYTKVTLNAMRKVLGEIYDVEISGYCSIEFGFVLPVTSKYILK
jgi:hypothetical protein